MIVDIHTHVGKVPEHIDERFIRQAGDAWADVRLGGTLDEHHAGALDGVDRAVVLAFNAPAAGFVVPNEYVAEYVAPHCLRPQRRDVAASRMDRERPRLGAL